MRTSLDADADGLRAGAFRILVISIALAGAGFFARLAYLELTELGSKLPF